MNVAKLLETTVAIHEVAKELNALENQRDEWTKPRKKAFYIGSIQHWLVRDDGTVPEVFQGIQREVLKMVDERIRLTRGKLEGLRFRLVQEMREAT